jgi:hypothetical protein
MEAKCGACGARHLLDDAQLTGLESVQFSCSACRQMNVVNLLKRPERTKSTTPLPSFARAQGTPVVAAELMKEPPGLALPADKKISLRVVSGLASGKEFPFPKPRMIVGRAGGGADIEIEDAEVSRWHCAVEVRPDSIWLRDLESTNGTYFDDERTRAALLLDGAEFRIGSTVLQISIKPAS